MIHARFCQPHCLGTPAPAASVIHIPYITATCKLWDKCCSGYVSRLHERTCGCLKTTLVYLRLSWPMVNERSFVVIPWMTCLHKSNPRTMCWRWFPSNTVNLRWGSCEITRNIPRHMHFQMLLKEDFVWGRLRPTETQWLSIFFSYQDCGAWAPLRRDFQTRVLR